MRADSVGTPFALTDPLHQGVRPQQEEGDPDQGVGHPEVAGPGDVGFPAHWAPLPTASSGGCEFPRYLSHPHPPVFGGQERAQPARRVERDGFGSMGSGDGQAQTHMQVYTAVARFGLNIQQAIEMPRWVHGGGGTFDDRETLLVENRIPSETLDALRQLGHAVEVDVPWTSAMGYAQGIVFDPVTGVMQGGSDPRAEGVAAGW